jgi:hypothetical protein
VLHLEITKRISVYLFRSSSCEGVGREGELMLPTIKLLQLEGRFVLRGRVGEGEMIPCSTSCPSTVVEMGSADVCEVLTVSAACVW